MTENRADLLVAMALAAMFATLGAAAIAARFIAWRNVRRARL